jgi:DNA-binding NarL/FixJ family response regulator
MSTVQPIRVLSIDDHPLLSEGIATMINNEPDMKLVATASTGKEGILKHREIKPDITLMDLRLPDLSGIDVMIAIRTESPDARIILLTMFAGDVEIQRALAAGAHGYLLKSMPSEQMLETIRQAYTGKKRVPPEVASNLAEHFSEEPLTNREIEVLRHLTEGNRNRDIAKRLFIAEETVKVHLKHIMEKLGASDRTHAMAIAARRGFIHI